MVLSLFLSVLDRDAHVVDVCGKISVVHIHKGTKNIHTNIRAMLQLMLLAFCPSPSRPNATLRSLPKQRPTTIAFSVVRLPSSNVVPHGSNLSFVASRTHLPLRLTSCPCLHLFVGTRTSNAHTEGNGSNDPSNHFLPFQQQRFLIQELFICGFV